MRFFQRPGVMLVIVVALAASIAWSVSPPEDAVPEVDPQSDIDSAPVVMDAQAGGWYCPAEDADAAEDESLVVAVRPAVDARPARFTTRVIGATGVTQIGEVFPGAGQQVTGPEEALQVRWTDRPVTVSRIGVVEAEPTGVLARPCVSRVASTWTLPGMTTAGGASATLRLTNPLSQEAAVAVRGLTPQGLEAPIVLQNISVPPGETVEVNVNEFLPQQPDLALHVVAQSGRIVLDAVLESQPTVSGVAGRSPLMATATNGTRWYLPWVATHGRVDGRGAGPVGDSVAVGDDATAEATPTPTVSASGSTTPAPTSTPTTPAPAPTSTPAPAPTSAPAPASTSTPAAPSTPSDDASDAIEDILDVVVEGEAEPASWLWLANPSEEAANVQISWLTSEGRLPATILGTVEVAAETVRRLSLDDVLPDVQGDIGVDVQVTNDVPIAVAGATVVDDGDTAARTGIAVLEAIASDDDVVSMTTVSQRDREQWLTVANPFGIEAVVDLRMWNGATSQAPDALSGLTLAPGSTVSLDVTPWATGSREFTVFAVAREGSVTGVLRGLAPEGPLRYSATAGVPLAIWTADGSLVSVHREDGLVNRLGTDLGLPLTTPTPTPMPQPSPTPSSSNADLAPSSGPTTTPSESPSPSPSPSRSPSPATSASSSSTSVAPTAPGSPATTSGATP